MHERSLPLTGLEYPDGPGGRHLNAQCTDSEGRPPPDHTQPVTVVPPADRRNFRGRLPGAAGQLGAVDELRTMPFTDAPHCPLAPFWAIHAALELAALGRAQAAAAFVTILRLTLCPACNLQPSMWNFILKYSDAEVTNRNSTKR